MNIIALLKQKNISQRDLSKKLGKDPAYINRMMKTDYDPRLSTVMAVADALQCTTDEIVKEIKSNDNNEDHESLA